MAENLTRLDWVEQKHTRNRPPTTTGWVGWAQGGEWSGWSSLMMSDDGRRRMPTKATAEAAEIINAIAKESFKGGVIVEKVTGHLSTGYLELRNTNPNDNPAVTFN
ncbi:hypothetical protein CFP56_001109 [Quercus suber]|uniref:Uncharacterized protein n=1 Tax=Quercus suber TaxID=58331 RepID=A0AAW0IMS1_QUESU